MSLEIAHSPWAGPSGRPTGVGLLDTGLQVVIDTPTGDADAWRCYRDGLQEAYEHYGVSAAAHVDEARTALFFTVFTAAGRAVGGARFLGPHHEAWQIDTLSVWPDDPAAWAVLRECAPDGVVDLEGVWVRRDAPERAAVTAAVRRMPLGGAALLGVRWCVAAAAEHSLPLWRASGGEVVDVLPVPYPDERYVTRLVLWDRERDLAPRIPQPRAFHATDHATDHDAVVDGGTEVL